MKFGIHSGLWMTRWTDEIGPILSTVADLGFDGVEISLLGMTLDRAGALKAAAKDRGLEITCSTGLGVNEDPTSADADMRKAARAALENAVRITAALGASQLAGVLAAPWGVFDPGDKNGRAERSAELLGQVDTLLAQEGVVLGVEVINRFETDLVNTASEGVALATAAGSPRIGVLLDTFHMNMEEKDPPAAIRETGEKLFHFHISDNDRGTPGNGHFDFNSSAAALRDIGYDGWITAEMFVVPGHPASADLNIWRNIEAESHRSGAPGIAIHEGDIPMTARAFFERLLSVFTVEEGRLNDLDAAIGDGDHGTTMLRGLTAAAKAENGGQAKAFMRASGGAAGTLFGLVLHEIEIYLSRGDETPAFHLSRATERIKVLGKVEPGDKSMVDALAPAVTALDAGRGINAAVAVAAEGRDSTRDMAARRGRARYVENAGAGHLDPGAVSVCLILKALADQEERR